MQVNGATPTAGTGRRSGRDSGMEGLRILAENRVLTDLVHALMLEDCFGMATRGTWTSDPPGGVNVEPKTTRPGEGWFWIPLGDGGILFRALRGKGMQRVRISRPPVWHVSGEGVEILGPVRLMRLLTGEWSFEEREKYPNLDGFVRDLDIAVEHTALSLEGKARFEGEKARTGSLLWAERLASMRDRPFHPVSRAKTGWNEADYRTYSPEFGHAFGLDWIAVRRDHLRTGSGKDSTRFAELLLEASDRDRLRQALDRQGLSADEWGVFPVHPWQMEHVLPEVFRQEWERGILRLLVRGVGRFLPTSSLRSLVPVEEGLFHVKLPLGVQSLGALRILPPRYMDNGEKAEGLLRRLIRSDPLLKGRLLLCDETNWAAFLEPGGDPFADKPGHLAGQIRVYPREMKENPDVEWIPMSALAVDASHAENPAVSGMLRTRSKGGYGRAEVLALFREVCDRLMETGLTCARYGVMPEMHGQNVVLGFREGTPERLLLRDHDTLRIHPAWMKEAGVPEPGYTVKPGTPNTLILPSPEEMFAYFLTLGIQVNLYAIAEAWSRTYEIGEEVFWAEIRASAIDALNRLPLPDPVRRTLGTELLHRRQWPLKQLIAPLLKRKGSGGGSMPSAMGRIRNPLAGPGCEGG